MKTVFNRHELEVLTEKEKYHRTLGPQKRMFLNCRIEGVRESSEGVVN